jgi:hypothetical protein
MYVAYVDESDKGGPIFTVASLTSTPARWIEFEAHWQAVLDAPPRIPYFGLNHSDIPKRHREAKIEPLIEVINKFVERADLALIHTKAYRAFFKGKISPTHDNPFFAGYSQALMRAVNNVPDPGARVDFVFDEIDDTHWLEVLDAHKLLKSLEGELELVGRVGAEPMRRDDEEVLPLQAADLWAGLFRRAYGGNRGALDHLYKFQIPNAAMVLDADAIAQWYRRGLSSVPGFDIGTLYETKKQRSARLAPARKLLRSSGR